jgi:phosphoglycerol transferase MdoB-like AlkP superfamily enzyme
VTHWSDQVTAQNGYFSSTIYFEAMMANDKKIANELYGDGAAYEKPRDNIVEFLTTKGNTRNIHVIVLEGFINPALLTKVNFSMPPFDKEFSNLVKGKESALISPVFGGYTAQAEFEILCGVPALHKYSSIEFNSFTNNPTFCMPGMLQQAGYRTVVSNGYKPNFFNEANAYQGVGFGEVYFPRQYAPSRSTYLSLVDDTQYIFDGDLFNQNIDFLKKHLAEGEHKPILNYVLGVYGHLPFKLDQKRHPLLIKATVKNRKVSDELDRVSNQIYYRSQALAVYLNELIEMDPHSLIIVTGDHLPRLDGTEFYKKLGWRHDIEDAIHQPPSFFIVDGKMVAKDTMHQYDVINTVFDYMTNNEYCKAHECKRSNEALDHQYNMIMARALR